MAYGGKAMSKNMPGIQVGSANKQYTLTISQPAGNYLLEIIDSEGRRMKRKVVIE